MFEKVTELEIINNKVLHYMLTFYYRLNILYGIFIIRFYYGVLVLYRLTNNTNVHRNFKLAPHT